jgi:NAD(P)-dependent dehydrogenase (short-subunit alcohol dehydrogenase family)
MELGRYGVRVNCIAPMARTRLTLETPGMDEMVGAPEDAAAFDFWDPANVSPLVAYLSSAGCPFTGGVFHVGGDQVGLFIQWTLGDVLRTDGRWTVDRLAQEAPQLLEGRHTLASMGTTVGQVIRAATAS